MNQFAVRHQHVNTQLSSGSAVRSCQLPADQTFANIALQHAVHSIVQLMLLMCACAHVQCVQLYNVHLATVQYDGGSK